MEGSALLTSVQAFATALAIGLLIGMERERRADSSAGLRTFALTAMLGCLFAMLDSHASSYLLTPIGLVVLVAVMVATNVIHAKPEAHPGFTSEAALLVTYGLGAAVWFGYLTLAVMLAIATTMLLYFKTELKILNARMTPKDINSILQFAVLSFVILPILPDQDFGPFNAMNLQQIWWMVVLISGLALAGYLALRIIGARYGAVLLGVFGGLASSTATTMMFSRHAAQHLDLLPMSTLVILIANVMVMLRVGVVASILAPDLMDTLAVVMAGGIFVGVVMIAYGWHELKTTDDLPMPEVTNPTELKTAISFAVLYACMLVLAAWVENTAGSHGLMVIAGVSGLTDADASVLTTLRMLNLERISHDDAIVAVVLAILANLLFKMGLIIGVGGKPLAKQALPGLLLMGTTLLCGLYLL